MLGAWGVSRVEGDARWRVRESDARRLARGTIDESARVGQTTFRRMNPMILHALMCLQPPLDDDVRPGPEPCLSITLLPPRRMFRCLASPRLVVQAA